MMYIVTGWTEKDIEKISPTIRLKRLGNEIVAIVETNGGNKK